MENDVETEVESRMTESESPSPSVQSGDTEVARKENGDGTVTVTIPFTVDTSVAAEMAKAMPKGQTRDDQSDAAIAADSDFRDVNLVEHDRRYHKNGYKHGDCCLFRESLEKYYDVDVAVVEEQEARQNMITIVNAKMNHDLRVLQMVKDEVPDQADFYKAVNNVFAKDYEFLFGEPTGIIKDFGS